MRRNILLLATALLSLSLIAVFLSSCSSRVPPEATPLIPIQTIALPSLSPPTPTKDERCPNRDPADPPWVCRQAAPTPASTRAAAPAAPTLPDPFRIPTALVPTGLPTWQPYSAILPLPLVSATPSTPAACPPSANPQFVAPELDPSILFDSPNAVLQPYLSYLNAGGSPAALPNDSQPYQVVDLTGDDVPEIVLRQWGVFVLGCQDGSYRALLSLPTDDVFLSQDSPYIPPLISDANRNNLPELVVALSIDNGGGAVFGVYEWESGAFTNILGSSQPLPFQPFSDAGFYYNGYTAPAFEDADDDSLEELVFSVPVPGWSTYVDGLPWREEEDVFEWDGYVYQPFETRFAEPQYRFQAVQDGDRATLFGRYDEALGAYQVAIFSDKVTWWSPERRAYLQEEWDAKMAGMLPESPAPYPDPEEYPHIAAYSRFRIMLLHVLRGWNTEANTVYETLLSKYPSGSSGGVFSDMATAFMDRYGAGGSIAESCYDAVHVAESAGSQALYYLGSEHHGWQSRSYDYPELCPFGYALPGP